MQRYFFPSLLLFLMGALSVTSCKHEPLIPVDPGGNDTIPTTPNTGVPCDPDSVYFQNQILPILISNCTQSGCHNASDHKEGVVTTSYSTVMSTMNKVNSTNWGQNELIKVLTDTDPGDRMPYNLPALPTAQIDLIKKWVQQGAQNNSCNENYGACDTTSAKYSTFIAPLVQQKCLGCHSGTNAQGGVKLTNYTEIKQSAQNGKFYASVTRTAAWMPQGGAKLDPCTLAKIKYWIDGGAPNN